MRVQWFCQIADGLELVRKNRPALQIVFLVALAEGIAKQRVGKKMGSFLGIKEFFKKYINASDKKHLEHSFRRSITGPRLHKLTFTSQLRILYEVRNRVVHGEEFWVFFFMGKKEKERYIKEKFTDYAHLTEGWLGKQNRKRRVSLEMTLTYEEFKNIVIRTAIANINAVA